MNNELRFIKQFYTIGGSPRNPGVAEDGKKPTYNSTTDLFEYTDDITLVSAAKDPLSNDVIFTFSNGSEVRLALGELAWSDDQLSFVTSVFGRDGDVTAQSGDYTAAQVTNAFDKAVDDLDDIGEGAINKHFTATYKNNVDLNTAARHSHANKTILDDISDAGGGVIPTEAQITAWDAFVATTDEHIRDIIAAALTDATGITWSYDQGAGTITPTINLSDFTTDNLPEGTTNLYRGSTQDTTAVTITLPAAASVANRCSAAIEGTDYPTGWILAADTSPVDLLITHGEGRRIADVSVFSVDAMTSAERKLMGSSAFTGIISPDGANNTIRIEGLATINTQIVIHLLFANV